MVSDRLTGMEHHMTVRPAVESKRFEVAEVIPGSHDKVHDRTYGRLDAAVSKAWTLAKRTSIPLILSIDPGRPRAKPLSPPQQGQDTA